MHQEVADSRALGDGSVLQVQGDLPSVSSRQAHKSGHHNGWSGAGMSGKDLEKTHAL